VRNKMAVENTGVAMITVKNSREEEILEDLRRDAWICDDISNWL
jgi:hypothetical protein